MKNEKRTPKTYGYARVSTIGQNLDRQLFPYVILVVTSLDRFGRNYMGVEPGW